MRPSDHAIMSPVPAGPVRRVCIVSDEFYPVRPGGIGRVLHNLLTPSPNHAEIHILMIRTSASELGQLNELFSPRIRFHTMQAHPDIGSAYGPHFATVSASEPAPFITSLDESRAVLYGLLRLEAQLGAVFDVVEFPDFRGWAYSSIQAKRSGLAFSRTVIAVRLHSTQSIIDRYEERYASHDLNSRGLKELERLALRDADLIVGHVPSIIPTVQSHFEFPQSWLAKTIHECLPILPLEGSLPVPPLVGERNIVFSGRLAPIKDVTLFIRACCLLLRREPSWAGDVVLACGGWQKDYIEKISDLIPLDLKARITWRPDLDHGSRVATIQNSIFVMPSRFESCCLAVYEASLASAIVVLNGSCPAFDDHSPWLDGQNCYKFSGGSRALATALKRAIHSQSMDVIDASGQRPYFETASLSEAVARLVSDRRIEDATLSVMIHVDDNAEHLSPTIDALMAIKGVHLQTIFIEDASLKPETTRLIDYHRWRLGGPEASELLTLPVKHGRANAFREGWDRASGEVVAFLEVGAIPDAHAYSAHAEALAANRVDVVFPTVGGIRDIRDMSARIYDRVLIAGTGGFPVLDTYYWAPGSLPLIRRSAFTSYPIDTEIEDFEFLDFGLRWADHVRIAATPGISLNVWSPGQMNASDGAGNQSASSLRNLLAHLDPTGGPAPRECRMAVAKSCALLMPWKTRMEAMGVAEPTPQVLVPAFIQVAGQVNPLGLGQEVWFLGSSHSSAHAAFSNSLVMSGDWALDDHNALKSYEIGASIKVQLDLTSGVTPYLKFLSHPWSGSVQISVGRFRCVVDLFGAETTNRIVEIPLDAI